MDKELPIEIRQEFKRILIETYYEFCQFCHNNDITFFGGYGTAIGAVRHKGLIPWDDDIDVCMLRKDYERFLSLKDHLTGSSYEIRDWRDKDYYLPFAKWCNKNTTILPYEESRFPLGVYIDIFPLDKVKGSTKTILLKARLKRLPVRFYMWSNSEISNGKVTLLKCFHLIFRGLKFLKPLWEAIIKRDISSQGYHSDYLYVSTYGEYREKEIFPPQWFESVVDMPFENGIMPLPVGYKSYLSQLYGDYMQLPPKEKRISRHECYYLNLHRRISLSDIQNKTENAENDGWYF